MKKALFVIAVLAPIALMAQQDKLSLIKTGKLFDSETAAFKPGLDILVRNGRIETVKPDAAVTAEEKAAYTLIDLSKYTVLPGLIDCHTHLLYKEEVAANMPSFSFMSLEKRLTMEGDAFRAIYGTARAKGYLEAGITTVQDLGNSGSFGDIALRKAIFQGIVPGPNMSCSGPGLTSQGAQLPGLIYRYQAITKDEYRIVTGVADAIQAVRENVAEGVNVIKIYSDNAPGATMLSVEEMRAIVTEAHRYNMRVTAHATYNQSVYNAVIAGVDGIEHGYGIADSTLVLMAKKQVFLIPTDQDSTTQANYFRLARPDMKDVATSIANKEKRAGDRLQRAIKFGVPIAYGSDDYIDLKMPFGESSKRTLLAYQEEGVTVPQILQFATLNGARQVNRSNFLGILKNGYSADIIAVDNGIEKDIRAILQVHFVMIRGTVYLQH